MAEGKNIARAAAFGGAAGLVLGGAAMFYVGIMRAFGAIDCAGMSSEECAMEHSMYKSIGNLQVIAGIALFLLGLSLYVLSRRPRNDGGQTS